MQNTVMVLQEQVHCKRKHVFKWCFKSILSDKQSSRKVHTNRAAV